MVFGKKIFANIGVQWLENIIVLMLRLVSFTIIVRSLTSAELGKYSLVTNMVIFFVFLTDFGLDDTLVRTISVKPKEGKNLLANLAVIKFTLALLSISLMLATVFILGYKPQVIKLAIIVSSVILFMAMISVAVAYFRINLRMKYVSAANVTAAVVFTTLVIIISVSAGNLWQYTLAWVLSQFVNLLVIAYLFLRFRPFEWEGFDFVNWRLLFAAAIPLGLAYFLSNIYASIDIIILSLLAGFKATGVYSTAYKLIHVGVVFPYTFVNTFYPMMGKYWQEDRELFKKYFQQAFNYLNLMAWPLVASIWLLAPKIMSVMFKKQEYIDGAIALQLLSIALGLMFLSILVAFSLAASNQQKKALILSLIGVLVNIGLNIIFVPAYGYLATSVVTIVTEL
ncbi:MAG TPA: flippase, partial [Actinobacteria bacterium]|nr:flippase [Actinomycetes bacterium]HEX21340.1 flippase [Actinomycetota bacterium]